VETDQVRAQALETLQEHGNEQAVAPGIETQLEVLGAVALEDVQRVEKLELVEGAQIERIPLEAALE